MQASHFKATWLNVGSSDTSKELMPRQAFMIASSSQVTLPVSFLFSSYSSQSSSLSDRFLISFWGPLRVSDKLHSGLYTRCSSLCFCKGRDADFSQILTSFALFRSGRSEASGPSPCYTPNIQRNLQNNLKELALKFGNIYDIMFHFSEIGSLGKMKIFFSFEKALYLTIGLSSFIIVFSYAETTTPKIPICLQM